MKKAFLLIVVPVLLVTLGFGQTPAPNSDPEQASIKGCLGGSDSNYNVAEDGTTQTFRVTSSTVDLKPHLGHDVEIIGQTTNVAPSSGPPDNTVIVTGVNMISDHCATATASTPAAADPTPTATTSTPAVADPTPAATAAAPAVADPTPTATASAPVVADPTPTATTSTPAVADPTPAGTAAAPVVADPTPAATASAPAMADPAPAATASAPMTASTPESSEPMPDTASPLPLLGLLGFGLLTTGLLSRRLWTNQR
jgi:hypothetical protein